MEKEIGIPERREQKKSEREREIERLRESETEFEKGTGRER